MFAYKWESRELKNVRYVSANLALIISTLIVTAVVPCTLMPPTPHSLVTVVQEGNQLFIAEAISFAEINGGDPIICRYGKCVTDVENNIANLEHLDNYTGDNLQQNRTILTFIDMSRYPELFIYQPESAKLQKLLQDADCVMCKVNTNLCSKLTHQIKMCICTSRKYLYVGPGFDRSEAELFDLSPMTRIDFTRPIPGPPDPPLGPVFSYAIMQTEGGILHCGGAIETENPDFFLVKDQCYLLSKLGVWKSHPSMLERRYRHTMVMKMSEMWVTGGVGYFGT